MNKKEILEKLDNLENKNNSDYIYIIKEYCYNDDVTIEKLEDYAHEMADSMIDIYTSDLFKWLADDVSNLYLVDEAVQEYGIDIENFSIVQAVQSGQYKYHYDQIAEIIYSLRD